VAGPRIAAAPQTKPQAQREKSPKTIDIFVSEISFNQHIVGGVTRSVQRGSRMENPGRRGRQTGWTRGHQCRQMVGRGRLRFADQTLADSADPSRLRSSDVNPGKQGLSTGARNAVNPVNMQRRRPTVYLVMERSKKYRRYRAIVTRTFQRDLRVAGDGDGGNLG
jgi:hypothetical protein